MSKRNMGRLGLVIMALLWGSSFAMNQVAMMAYTPFQLLALRYVIAAEILIVLNFKQLFRTAKNTWLKGTILGIVLYAAYAFQTKGLSLTTATNNAFLTSLNVILVPFISSVFMKRKIASSEYLGAIMAMAGITVMSLTERFGTINLGDMLTLISAIFFALHILFTDKFAKEENVMVLTTIQLTVTGLCAVLIALIEKAPLVTNNHIANVSVLYLTLFCTMIAFLLQTYSQQYTSETETVLIMSTESIFALLFAVVIMNEMPSGQTLLGAGLILTGVLVTELKPKSLLSG
ncbi:DMT family transporter [Aerococcaceae bacterium DSM 111020]|nr:DMT family transporter [Aerococcaceae bacterium DSM 111020]